MPRRKVDDRTRFFELAEEIERHRGAIADLADERARCVERAIADGRSVRAVATEWGVSHVALGALLRRLRDHR